MKSNSNLVKEGWEKTLDEIFNNDDELAWLLEKPARLHFAFNQFIRHEKQLSYQEGVEKVASSFDEIEEILNKQVFPYQDDTERLELVKEKLVELRHQLSNLKEELKVNHPIG
jgi:protein subunit release factor A